MTVLPDLQAQMKELRDMLAAQAQENALLKAALETRKTGPSIITKVNDGEGQKGGISVFVNSRHPCTMYASQWLAFLDHIKAPADSPMRQFIEANRSRLAWKSAG